MKQWMYAGAALLALGACASTPPQYEDVVTPVAHDFRVAPPPVEEEPLPTPTSHQQYVSANGELCAPAAHDAKVMVCGVGAKTVVVNDILSDSF